MAQHAAESIWHFAGYLHIADLLSYTPIHYSGAPVFHPSGYTPEDGEEGSTALRLSPAEPSKPVIFAETTFAPGHSPAPLLVNKMLPIPDLAPITVPPASDFQLADHGVPPQGVGSFGGGALDLKITLTYTEIPSYFASLAADQRNVLFDDDVLTGDSAKLASGDLAPPDPAPILVRMIDAAEVLVPVNALAGARPADNDAGGRQSPTDPFPIDVSGDPDAAALEVEETSHYVNGARVDDPESPPDANAAIRAQSEDIQAALEAFDAGDDPEDEGGGPPEPPPGGEGATAEGEEAHAATDGTPTGGYAQDTVTGENEALNIAVLDDRTDELSSLVIEGDYHELDAIVQINILEDNDFVRVDGASLAQSIVTRSNSLVNDATFVADPGQVFGDGVSGFSGALHWNVTYVTGDYWSIAALEQHNVLVDGDLSQQTNENSNFTAVLGSDGQLNLVELTQASAEYDLIVIGGDYFDLNTIIQINLLLDDDAVLQALGGAGSQSIDAGSNVLKNDAAIVSIGSESFKPLDGNANAEALAEAIAEQEAIIDAMLALGVPRITDGTFDVLYVAGDYYDLDIVIQTNVVADADAVEQAALDGAAGGAVPDENLAQTVTAGGNEATNLALIIDVDSLSGYQYLGGEAYEDTLLVQANIVSDDDDVMSSPHDLDPDVVAAIAAMVDAERESGNSGHGSSGHGDSHNSGPSDGAPDLLGSVMA